VGLIKPSREPLTHNPFSSWQNISASSRTASDETTADLLRGTVVHALLFDCLSKQDPARADGSRRLFPQSVRHLTEPPAIDSLRARLGWASEVLVARLHEAVKGECAKVAELVDKFGLDANFQMALQIAQRDVEGDQMG